ncbi:MAG: Rpn family recombination-promoting nuclease/putative transposase, partial [Candidatus Riflebacteria bacterium]|nr:Rpn family recombination-promoting nuclease/putative transposase [Candidatus Riflebacteria bacterium]
MIRLNPKIDIAFRKLFGSEENKEILRGFINSVLPAHEQVKTLEIKNPYNLASYIKGKSNVLDVKARGEDGRWFDVELQVGEQEFFGKRIKYYLDKVYVDQLIVAGEY